MLANHQEKELPVKLEDVALFYLENELVHIVTFDHMVCFLKKSLEELEVIIGTKFYRINRQFLVNREAILGISVPLSKELMVNVCVPVKVQVMLNKESAQPFVSWLIGR